MLQSQGVLNQSCYRQPALSVCCSTLALYYLVCSQRCVIFLQQAKVYMTGACSTLVSSHACSKDELDINHLDIVQVASMMFSLSSSGLSSPSTSRPTLPCCQGPAHRSALGLSISGITPTMWLIIQTTAHMLPF